VCVCVTKCCNQQFSAGEKGRKGPQASHSLHVKAKDVT